MNKTTEFIAKAKKIHDNKYSYSKTEYIHSQTKIDIMCPTHGWFKQLPTNHLSGSGCRKCGFASAAKKLAMTSDQFLVLCAKQHNNKYDYSQTNYVSSHTKISITCPKHGLFEQEASSHLRGAGCSACGRGKLTLEEFINRSSCRHGGKYLYDNCEYINYRTPVSIECGEHGQFLQIPRDHLRGHGCPKCLHKTQLFIFNVCQELFPDNYIEYNYRRLSWLISDKGRPMEIDIYVPDLKLAIEYDGEQHFRPVAFNGMSIKKAKNNFKKLKANDNFKNKLIAENSEDIKYFIRFDFKEILTKKYIKEKILRFIK